MLQSTIDYYLARESYRTEYLLAREITRLDGQIESLLRELDRERETFPSEGIFLVEHRPGGRSYIRISKLGELPEPLAHAAAARHLNAIARAIVAMRESKGHYVSAMEIAEVAVRAIYEEEQKRATVDEPRARDGVPG